MISWEGFLQTSPFNQFGEAWGVRVSHGHGSAWWKLPQDSFQARKLVIPSHFQISSVLNTLQSSLSFSNFAGPQPVPYFFGPQRFHHKIWDSKRPPCCRAPFPGRSPPPHSGWAPLASAAGPFSWWSDFLGMGFGMVWHDLGMGLGWFGDDLGMILASFRMILLWFCCKLLAGIEKKNMISC